MKKKKKMKVAVTLLVASYREVAMLTKTIRRLMKLKNQRGENFKKTKSLKMGERRKDSSLDKNDQSNKDGILCYSCNKPGHFKYECPHAVKLQDKKKKIKGICCCME